MTDGKKYWQLNIEKIVKDIKEATYKSRTEEDLKMSIEPLLQSTFKKMGVDVDIVQYEKTATSFKGKADAVYGYLTIEYKSPGKLSDKSAEETAQLYQLPGGSKLKQLLFAIHTFYAFLMKLIAIELVALQRESSIESFVKRLGALDDRNLFEKLSYLESGGDFNDRGIKNFLEADFFSWYLDIWNPQIAETFRMIVRALSDFEPATPILEPEWTKDLLQELYEIIVPRKLRHDLGEYYTPDWLAGYVVEKSGFQGEIGQRFLDPSCGSGTFLVQAINKAIRSAEGQKQFKAGTIASHILDNIVGFDLNPLAVLAARTNYLIAFSKFIPFVRPISIPVYLCDSVLAPTRYSEEGSLPFDDTIVFTTTKGDYIFPLSMQDKDRIDKFTSMIDIALRAKMEPDNFKKQIKKEFNTSDHEKDLLIQVYRHIKELDDNGENGIWARYIKNAFAPTYLGLFDFVVGNPPWIRWGYLSDDYRKQTLKLWHRYGLFSLKGHEARLGAGEKDFSMLFTYACADNYLKEGGILGFIITMEVFKSKGAGEGFRQFQIKDKRIPLKILGMEDMVDLKPFQAANKTSLLFLKKGEKTRYPVPALEWKRKKGIGRILPTWTLAQAMENCKVKKTKAMPVHPGKPFSSWQSAPAADLKLFSKLKGKSHYKAHLGARVEPYGVFWLDIKEVRPDGLLVIENLHERGKREIKSVRASIEPDLVYPAVSGGDIVRFGIKSNLYILISQDPEERCGYDEEHLSTTLPLTYAYLFQFKDILIKRAAYKKYFCKEIKKDGQIIQRIPEAPFYSMYNISNLTFSKYRVTWQRMASKMNAVVLSSMRTDFGTKKLISTDTTSFFSINDRKEAHYLCALLNSGITNAFIQSFSSGGRGFGAPSVMGNIAIPKFTAEDRIHVKLAELSEEAHSLVQRGTSINAVEDEINSLARELWNIE